MEKDEKLEEVKDKLGGVVGNIGDKFTELSGKIGTALDTEDNNKKQKAIVTSRVLFVSILDKLLLISFIIAFAISTFATFAGDLSSSYYGFWSRVGTYVWVLIVLAICYLFYNWLYRCVAKTMLCLTKNEVYLEHYVPFKKTEKNVPLEKITKVSTVDILWIFRVLVIHQYHQFPIVFWTWTNHEFKDALNELITGDKEKVENEFESKNIIPNSWMKHLKWFALGVVALVAVIGIFRGVAYMFSPSRAVPGTYEYEGKQIVLNKDGSCEIDDLIDNSVTACQWTYSDESENILVSYDYQYKSWYSTYDRSSSFILGYDSKNKSVIYSEAVFSKK